MDTYYVHKGEVEQVDDYSAVYNRLNVSETLLPVLLDFNGITDVYVAGLALDYCVKYTAIDLQTKLKLKTTVLIDATKPVAHDTGKQAIFDLQHAGVMFATTKDLMPKMNFEQ